MLYWEDLEVGRVDRFGAYALQAEEIRAFDADYGNLARPVDVDRPASTAAEDARPQASSALVCAAMMRMLVDNALEEKASMGSPGLESASWQRPVYAGDVLSVRQEIRSSRALSSRPELGLVVMQSRVMNQHQETVAEIVSNVLFRRRSPDDRA